MNLQTKYSARIVSSIAFVLLAFVFFTACKDEVSNPPQLKLFVNGVEKQTVDTITIIKASRNEYKFEVISSSNIATLKTVISDLSNPAKKVSKEYIVGGQTASMNETVKGVLFPLIKTELMLVVTDTDGNESTKSCVFKIQP